MAAVTAERSGRRRYTLRCPLFPELGLAVDEAFA